LHGDSADKFEAESEPRLVNKPLPAAVGHRIQWFGVVNRLFRRAPKALQADVVNANLKTVQFFRARVVAVSRRRGLVLLSAR
jgi:hypothetical protein